MSGVPAHGARHLDLFQAVRLIRRLRRAETGVGGESSAAPDGEVPRFRTPATLAFPPTSVGADDGEPALVVSILGLTGPAGVLPRHYTRELIAREADSDEAMHAFLDMFSHRLIDLYYRSWERTKLHVRHEREDPRGPSRHLRSLAGAGVKHPDDGPGALTPDAMAYFAGLLGQQPRSAQAIRQVLADLLGVPVTVEQFVGTWLSVPESGRCRLAGAQDVAVAPAPLGEAVLGDRIWDRRSTLRIRIGPLDRSRFGGLLPRQDGSSPVMRALLASLAVLVPGSTRLQIQLVVRGPDVPALRLGPSSEEGTPPILGISTWLGGRPPERDADDTLLA